jgi:NADH-ubiquinone oxidoreductase chain 5
MMVIAVGLSSYDIALFHLVNHAFYKALLFLGAGAVIHAVADNQDFRRYGGLKPFLPLTYSVMLIASLSLVAFPFMTGFYSKDFILESAYGQYYFSGTVVYIIATIGAMFTTLYSVKVLYLTFLTNPNGPLINYKNAHEGDIFMSSPLMILAVFSIFFGFITKDMFIGLGSGFFSDNALFIHPTHEIMLDTEFGVPTMFKLLPLMFTISLSVIAILLSEFLSTMLISFKLSRTGYNIFGFFNQRFLIESFYNTYVSGIIFKLGGQTSKVLDKGSVEYIGPYGLEKGLTNISSNISNLNTGSVTTYALFITTGVVLYISFSSYLSINILILSILLALSLSLYNNNAKLPYSLESSSFLTNKVTWFNSKCMDVPSGREIRDMSGHDIKANGAKISEIARDINKDHAEILIRASQESSSPGVSHETQQRINTLTQTANESARDARRTLTESMQSCIDVSDNLMPFLVIGGEIPIASILISLFSLLRDRNIRICLLYCIDEKYTSFKSKLTTFF